MHSLLPKGSLLMRVKNNNKSPSLYLGVSYDCYAYFHALLPFNLTLISDVSA